MYNVSYKDNVTLNEIKYAKGFFLGLKNFYNFENLFKFLEDKIENQVYF